MIVFTLDFSLGYRAQEYGSKGQCSIHRNALRDKAS
jgi:hypothetical protein